MSKKVITPAPEDFCKAIECFKKSVEEAKERFNNFTSVVRCKDCKHHYVDGDNVRFNMCLLNHNKVQPDDWFCADGERKSD